MDLQHIIEDSALFRDVSLELNDYLRDSEEVLLSQAVYYVGLYKPFRRLYVEHVKFNINSNASLSFDYWNGTDWQALPSLIDDTKGFQRNGFISWQFEDEEKITDEWQQTSINADQKYWIRITSDQGIHSGLISATAAANTETVWNVADDTISSYSIGQTIYEPAEDSYHTIVGVDSTPGAANITVSPGTLAPLPDSTNLFDIVELKGVNIVYADDNQLAAEVRIINDYLAEGDTSFIAYHLAARDDIVQTLRNGGNIKQVPDNNNEGFDFMFSIDRTIQMNKWDLLDVGEITQAAKYLCLAKIFFDVSENVDDKAYIRWRDYMDKYGQAFRLYYLSLDLDDDGNVDEVERNRTQSITLSKV
jgi:hypothetical protein